MDDHQLIALRTELLRNLDALDKKLSAYIKELDAKTDRSERAGAAIIQGIDKRLTYLESNTVTRKEFNDLLVRLDRIERGLRSV